MADVIAVSGASGTIGAALLPLLVGEGAEVRALSRSADYASVIRGVSWVRADLSEPRGLRRALEGSNRLFLLTGNTEDMVRLQTNAIRVATEVGISHLVKLSALGASNHSKSVIGLWHYNVERVLKEAELDWTILRPHHFMQNLLDSLVFDRDAGRIRSASGEGKIPFVDTRDIAAVAASVLTGGGHEGKTYTLTGPEARTYREATALVGEVLGRELEYVPETPDEAWRRHREAGHPVWLTAAQLAIAGYQREGGPTERTTDTVEALTGRGAHTLEAFVEDHVAQLRGR